MRKLLLQTCALLLLSADAFAQTGTLRGQVKDDSGAVVPSARVEINASGGFSKSTVSDSTGSYSFSGLSPGSYSVQASARSLAQPQPAGVMIKPGTQTLDLRLGIAKLVEHVTVDDTPGASIGTASAENANALVLQGQDLDALSEIPTIFKLIFRLLQVRRRVPAVALSSSMASAAGNSRPRVPSEKSA